MTNYSEHQEAVTNKLIDMIKNSEGGTWQLPWSGRDVNDLLSPRNAKTGVFYRGGNIFSLAMDAVANDHATGIWATYRQWKSIGAQVRKGEEASYIVKWIKPTPKDDDARQRSGMIPRVYAVHNADQVDGYDVQNLVLPIPAEPIAAAEEWIASIGATVQYGGNRACYSPSMDRISMPAITQFTDQAAYYATLIHEHTHWTGHKSRLDRDQSGSMSTSRYAYEELVAELGAAIGCARLGISNEPREDHALYLSSWLTQLQADPKLLLKAGSAAFKAFSFLDGKAGGLLSDLAEPVQEQELVLAGVAA